MTKRDVERMRAAFVRLAALALRLNTSAGASSSLREATYLLRTRLDFAIRRCDEILEAR